MDEGAEQSGGHRIRPRANGLSGPVSLGVSRPGPPPPVPRPVSPPSRPAKAPGAPAPGLRLPAGLVPLTLLVLTLAGIANGVRAPVAPRSMAPSAAPRARTVAAVLAAAGPPTSSFSGSIARRSPTSPLLPGTPLRVSGTVLAVTSDGALVRADGRTLFVPGPRAALARIGEVYATSGRVAEPRGDLTVLEPSP